MKKALQDSIQEAVQKAWADLSSIFGNVEEEVSRRLQRAKERIDPHQAGEEIQRVLADVGKRLQESSEVLERRVEDGVKAVVAKVREPLADEIASLRSRAERLSSRIESQFRRQPPPEKPEE